ncbi:MAG: hypothetical protein ACJAZO_005276 [Myxococcota bacterium]
MYERAAQIGEGAEIRGNARIGRGAIVAAGASVESGAQVRPGATVCEGQTMGSSEFVARGETFPPEGCSPSFVHSWLPVHGQGVLSDGIGTNTVGLSSPTARNWNSVALAHDFLGGVQVLESSYERSVGAGAGAVYGPNVTFEDINRYWSHEGGTYWGELAVTGFPSGYDGAFADHYPVFGATSAQLYVRWTRLGTQLSIEYGTSSQRGPWSQISGSPYAVPATDTVVIGIGDGSGGDTSVDALHLLSGSN